MALTAKEKETLRLQLAAAIYGGLLAAWAGRHPRLVRITVLRDDSMAACLEAADRLIQLAALP